ncbi:ATP-binding protein [Ornithinibacillus bavariensis]|uniref:histidine kinase n=1 Tax=Ornithinibacillus bavariensis TaxID=545502 RepID=A0A920C6D8_9BACI|nr:ATP-binding protein [Ornithinibacillus bavariensis]GIO25587.1 histidine kinase [Ornithinibacillus bavariensis]
MRQIASIIISIIVVIVTIILLLLNLPNGNYHQVKDGTLNLSNWDGSSTVQLDGEWEFYRDVFVDPNEHTNLSPEFISVPTNWDDEFNRSMSDIQVGTYRLLIVVPEDDEYALRIDSIRHASEIYINGELVGGLGVPSSSRDEYSYREGKYIVRGHSVEKQLEIIVHVANASENTNGGIVKPVLFGKSDQISLVSDRSKFIDGVIVGGYILLGIIFLFYFVLQKNTLNELYFSLFCFVQGIYVSTQNEKLIYLLYPEIPMKWLLSIQLSFISLAVLFFFLFIYETFRNNTSNKLTKWIKWILLFQAIYFGIPKSTSLLFRYLSFVQYVFVSVLALAFIYIIVMIMKAFKQKVDGSDYLLVATTCFTAYVTTLGLELLFQINTEQIPLFLFLMMTMTFSFFIGYRRKLSYERIDNLSKELLVLGNFRDHFLQKTTEELKKPIHQITEYTNALMQGSKGPLKKEQYELAYRMHYSSKRLSSLVEDLNFVRGEHDHLQLDIKPVQLAIIDEVIKEHSFILRDSNTIKIENQIPVDLPYVLADENGLRQIIYQIIQNAIAYTKEGKITVSASYDQEKVYVSVEDTGIGIEEQYQEQIFNTFFQVSRPNVDKKGNLGLGLTITKKIIELMNGQIWVQSVPGEGSCFTFTLPVSHEKEIAASLDETEFLEENSYPIKHYQASDSKVILLLDQDYQHLDYMTKLLIEYGYSVLACNSSSDAYDLLQEAAVDLAIIDVKAQDEIGFNLLKQIREEYALAELPILLLSASGHNMPYYIQLGANDVITKPIDVKEFISHIQSLLLIKESFRDSIRNELKYYSGQIAPHFLYNTLNTIIALIYYDPEKSREALEHLSIYFRSKLDSQLHQELIPLANEIEFVQSYVEIEKLRYGDRLKVVYDIDEDINVLIPTMTLQPLVENAIQHGIAKMDNGGILKMTVKKVAGTVLITIEDNGTGIPEKKQEELLKGNGSRLGFKNPFEKIRLIKNATFELISREGKGTKIIIELK